MKRYLFLLCLIFTSFFILLKTAHAGCPSGNIPPYHVNFGNKDVSGIHTGQEIKTISFPGNGMLVSNCSYGQIYWKFATAHDPNGDQYTFQTNIKGVGIKAQKTGLCNTTDGMIYIFSGPACTSNKANYPWREDGTYTFTLIKTANVTSSGDFGGIRIASGYSDNTIMDLFLLEGSITVPSCNAVSTTNVPLGTWDTSDLSGIGSTTADVPLDLTISCPDSGIGISAKITADTDDSQPGTLNLADGSDSATGVGIQMMDASGDPLVLNTKFRIITSASAGSFNPGWKAHYIQTGTAVTPGDGNASITVAFTYN